MALMLLDTYGLVYRAYFALPGLTTSAGTPINAVYGFTMMLNKLIADEKPTHVVAAFDKGMPAERVALYAEYKAQRRAMPDELRGQFALVRQVLATYRIPVVEMEGQEADDVIATLARQAQEAGEQTIVVTGDLDLLQIVDDRVTVLVTQARHNGARALRSARRSGTLRARTRAAARLPRPQRGPIGQPSRNSRRRRKDRKQTSPGGRLSRRARIESGPCGQSEAGTLDRRVRAAGLPLPRRFRRTQRLAVDGRLGR